MKNVIIVLLALVAIGSLAGNAFLYQRYSTQRPVMTIGSEAISIKDYQDRVDYEAGKAVLNKMAYSMLVMQEAKKAGVVPTDEDVKKRIEEIRRRNPKALEAAMGNSTRQKELERSLKADMALENLTIKDVQVTEAELKDFYAKNQKLFAVPTQAKTTMVVAQNAVDANTANTMLKDKTTEARIIANQPGLSVVGLNGFQPNWSAVPAATQEELAQKVLNAPVGSIVSVQSGNIFIITRVEARDVARVEPFDKIKPLIERTVKLKKASPQQVVLARLYKDAKITFEVGKYAQYFKDMDDFAKANAGGGKQTANAK